jgi:uncharacterized protein YjbI with pentapeptide repeats
MSLPESRTKFNQEALDLVIKQHELFRKGQPGGVRAILTHHDLSNLVFRGKDLSCADFSGSLFYESDLTSAVLDNAVFYACDLRRANLHNATMVRADLRGACLRGATMTSVNLSDADLREGSFALYDEKKGLSFISKDEHSPEGAVDMRGAELSSANFSGSIAINANFTDANLNKASFIRADLSGANLSGANLGAADLSDCVLKNVNMRDAILVGAVIDFSKLVNVDMSGALTDKPAGKILDQMAVPLKELLRRHKLWLDSKGALGARLDLSGFDLRREALPPMQDAAMLIAKNSVWFGQSLVQAHMEAAQFEKSDLRNCDFKFANLRGSIFTGANLIGAKFNCAVFDPLFLEGGSALKTNFSGARLRYADFTQADLREVDFTGADLSSADFRGADIEGANFKGTHRTEAKFDINDADEIFQDA